MVVPRFRRFVKRLKKRTRSQQRGSTSTSGEGLPKCVICGQPGVGASPEEPMRGLFWMDEYFIDAPHAPFHGYHTFNEILNWMEAHEEYRYGKG